MPVSRRQRSESTGADPAAQLQLELAQAQAAEIAGKDDGGILGSLKSGLGSLAKTISLPGAIVVNGAAELGDGLAELTGIGPQGEFSLDDFREGVKNRKGAGDILQENGFAFDNENTAGRWANRFMGGALDIAADPTNLLTGGSSAAAKQGLAKVGMELGDTVAKQALREGGTVGLREALGDLPLEEVLARSTAGAGTEAGERAIAKQLGDLDRFAKGGIGVELAWPKALGGVGVEGSKRLTVGASKLDALGAGLRSSEMGKGIRASLIPTAKVADELGAGAELATDAASHAAASQRHRLARDLADGTTGKLTPEQMKHLNDETRITFVDEFAEAAPNMVSNVPKPGYVLVREGGEMVSEAGVAKAAAKAADPKLLDDAAKSAAEASVKGDNVLATAAQKSEKIAADNAAKLEQAGAKSAQIIADAQSKGAKLVEKATTKAQANFIKKAQTISDQVMKSTATIADGPFRQQQAALAIEAATAGLRAESEAAIAAARQQADQIVAEATAKADELVPAAQAAADEALTKAAEAGAAAREKADKLTAAGQDKLAAAQSKAAEAEAALTGRYIPEVVHNVLEQAFGKKSSEILDGLDAVTSFTKRFTTLGPVNAVPHVVRNIMSNMLFATMYGGATKLRYWNDSEKIGTALRRLALDETEVTAETLAKQGLSEAQVRNALDMQRHGLAGHGAAAADDVGQQASKKGRDLGRVGNKLNKIGKGHVVVDAGDLLGTRTAAGINQWHEHLANGAVYLRGIEDGLSPAAAAKKAREAMLDYSSVGLSKFERDYLQRLIFFYKFPRRAIPAGVKFTIEHPGAAMAASRAGAGMDLGERNEFGGPIGNFFDTPLESTAQNLMGLATDPVSDIVERTNPLFQGVLDDKKRGWGDILPPVGNSASKLSDPKLVGTQPAGLLGTTLVPGMVRGVDYNAADAADENAEGRAALESRLAAGLEPTALDKLAVLAEQAGVKDAFAKTKPNLLVELNEMGITPDQLASVLSPPQSRTSR